jgi:hypothetical protein
MEKKSQCEVVSDYSMLTVAGLFYSVPLMIIDLGRKVFSGFFGLIHNLSGSDCSLNAQKFIDKQAINLTYSLTGLNEYEIK